jgi:hypothetical protein
MIQHFQPLINIGTTPATINEPQSTSHLQEVEDNRTLEEKKAQQFSVPDGFESDGR